MINKMILIILIFSGFNISAQEYFQQEADYKIKVRLIDSIHTLEGNIEITYTNHSPDGLDYIYMHLWANAFKNRSTAFAKQKVRNFDTKFYFADESTYGGYSNLDFKVNGTTVNWALEDEIDIAKLNLNETLGPEQSITITTPFRLKIPDSYSRLGHVGTSYQMTQWYPKPAVYDAEGWHQMPYLDMGEFYSEFGNYEVEISLPANYYVGATGTLETEKEKEFLEERIAYTDAYMKDSLNEHSEFPPSSSEYKTLKYSAENVHDFAWFADKRFLVQKDVAKLASGRSIDCWAFFTDYEKDLWKDGAFFTKRAVEFYSDRVGEYPYPQATAVQSALSAGGGMEYPMITVIGPSGNSPALDQVITHEVGHNWFYGILASNERDYPWMDEGMNSYHDHKYTSIYYDEFDEFAGVLPAKINKQMEYSALSFVYQVFARIDKDQAPNTHSNELTMVNYFLGAYEKPAISFKILEEYLGEQKFIEAMKAYYNEWKFKHPQPLDTKKSFETTTGKNLDWLFDGLLFSNKKYDYDILGIDMDRKTFTVENKGEVNAPFNVTFYSDSTDATSVWYDGFLGTKTLEMKVERARYAEIDQERSGLDIDPSNNDYKIKGGDIPGKIKLRFLSGLRTSKTNKVFLLPLIGINTSNLLELGLAAHNYGIPLSKFQYYVSPMIGTRKGEILGSFEFRRDFTQRTGTLRNVSIALGGKSFHENYNENFDYNLRFSRIQPSIDLEWKDKWVSPLSQYLTYRPIIIFTESPQFIRENEVVQFTGKETNLAIIHDLGYSYVRRSAITPLTIKVNAEHRRYSRAEEQNQYLKLYASSTAKYAYKKGKFFELRGFAGFFPIHSEKNISTSAALGNFSLFHRGVNDYKYDDHFIDRNGQDGLLSRQVTMTDGAFKNGLPNSMPIGISNNYMASLNLSVDLPFGWTSTIPIKPYFDAGVYSFKPTTSDPFRREVLYSGGLMIDFRKVVMIHFPIFNSGEINSIYEQTTNNFWQRISFTLDLNQLDPHRLKHWFYR